jgi:hypothetical protein
LGLAAPSVVTVSVLAETSFCRCYNCGNVPAFLFHPVGVRARAHEYRRLTPAAISISSLRDYRNSQALITTKTPSFFKKNLGALVVKHFIPAGLPLTLTVSVFAEI